MISSKTPSGATLEITVAPFEDAKALEKEVFRALGGTDISGKEMMTIAMLAASSDAVEAAFFKCAARAIYKPTGADDSAVKVNRALFDDPKTAEQARGDYYDIFYKVAEANIKPFIQALFSALKGIQGDLRTAPPPSK